MLKMTQKALIAGFMVLSGAVAQPSWAFDYECTGDANKCPAPHCSGDETACAVLYAKQAGVDRETGAHVVIGFDVPSSHKPQTMDLVLTLGEKLSDCSGSARDTNANANNGSSRSIDGLLCAVRATWTRY